MAINLSDNVHASAPKPIESKYLNITLPYTGTSQVNSCIPSGERYTGLTVNILGIEYWYCNGIGNGNLVVKSSGGNASLSTFTISGDNITTGFTVNHALSNQFVNVQIAQAASPYETVFTNVDRIDANNVCITFDTAPLSGTNYKILIIS